MKAKVKATGEIVEVMKVCSTSTMWQSGLGNKAKLWNQSDLDFDNIDSLTIEGWVAVDEAYCGEAYLHTEKPHAESVDFCDTGDYEIAWRSEGKSYLLDRDLFPEMNEESEPKKVKITITHVEE